MRFSLLAFLGVCAVGLAAPLAAEAAPLRVAPIDAVSSAATVEVAAKGCGPHRHWVGAHRLKSGKRVAGRCVSNKH